MSLRAGLNQNKDKYAFLHVGGSGRGVLTRSHLMHLHFLLTVGGSGQLRRRFRSRVGWISFLWTYMYRIAEASSYVIIERLVSQHDQISVLLERVLVQRL